MEVKLLFAEILSFIGIGVILVGATYAIFSTIRFFMKKNISTFPIILGGSISLVGVWLVFIAGILIQNEQERLNSDISVVEETVDSTDVDDSENVSNIEEEQDNSKMKRFLETVRLGMTSSDYQNFIDENEIQVTNTLDIYGINFDELIIENQKIVVSHDENNAVLIESEQSFESIVEEHKTKIETQLTTNLQGTGDQGTDPINLIEGFAVFESTHQGNSNFVMELQNSNGDFIDLLANEIGSYSGKSFVWIEKSEDYYLNVKAQGGEWKIKITQFFPLEAPTLPGELTGDGDDVVFFKINSGSYQITLTHEGEANFIVLLDDSEVIVNEIGSYQGSQRFTFNESTVYVFEVKADGKWSINIE